MQELTNNALMLKVKSGELDKLGLLYERHKKRLFGFFYNMNNNASVSEDLVQNVFERMLKYKHTFTGEGSFTAWMFQTARNVNYDYYRKNRIAFNQTDVATVAYKMEGSESMEKRTDQKDDIIVLNRAMQLLKPEKREVLVLSKLKELKFSEVAEILGCTEGAAKVKAHRALKDLRAIFLQLETR
jgi:RNA polymerase sigma-70 factor (ECF subfamily)